MIERNPFERKKIMKKIIVLLLCVSLVLVCTACGGGGSAPPSVQEESNVPPALTLIRDKLSFNKRCPREETCSFSRAEIETALGSSITFLTLSSLPDPSSGTLMFKGMTVMNGQTLPAEGLGYLRFVPSGGGAETAEFCFSCDGKGYEDCNITCNLVFSAGENADPMASNRTLWTVEGIPCTKKLSVYDPDGDFCSLKIITYPSNGYVELKDDGTLVYTPKEGFLGKDTLTYAAVDDFGGRSENAKLTVFVEENLIGSGFSDMEGREDHVNAIRMCQNSVMIYRRENGQYLFEPDRAVSKMDFLVMLMCASGTDGDVLAVADTVADDDGALTAGFKGYLATALSKGIVRLESGKFEPKATVTASDAAYMVSRLLSLPAVSDKEVFGEENLPDWAADSLCSVMAAGIVNAETVGSEELTKAEVASLLCAVADYMEENGMTFD